MEKHIVKTLQIPVGPAPNKWTVPDPQKAHHVWDQGLGGIQAWKVNAKDTNKILRSEKLAVVPEIQPFCDSHFFVMANILTLEGKLPKHIKYVPCVQMP